ncbi:MAG: hypothetical protein ACOH1T_05140 [Microbacteriaceae bacterium]
MSLTISAPRATAPSIETLNTIVDGAPRLDWELVDCVHPQVWIGRVRGIFVGMVESRGADGFAVTTRLGRGLGTFSSLEVAQDAFIKR